MDQLPCSLWLYSLEYCTSSDLLRLLRCNRYCHQTLLADKTAELLLRRHFHLSKQQLTSLDMPASLTMQRLLAPLASLERQLRGQSPSALHTALMLRAICSCDLSISELAKPHSQPVPTDPRCESTQWVQQGPVWDMWDDCGIPDSTNVTLSCIGLRHMQLWFHAPFWQHGWADLVYSWTAAAKQADACASMGHQLSMTERDLICHQLDSRIRWIGCVQPDPTTVRAVGFYYGQPVRRSHWVPATFGRGGYTMELAYSQSTSSECERAMTASDTAVDELPVVTFDLSGSMETVNGHHLRLYDSLSVFLQSQAVEEGVEARQQVQQFVQQVREAVRGGVDSGAMMMDEKPVTNEQLKGLPLYLSCFPMPPNILSVWNTASR